MTASLASPPPNAGSSALPRRQRSTKSSPTAGDKRQWRLVVHEPRAEGQRPLRITAHRAATRPRSPRCTRSRSGWRVRVAAHRGGHGGQRGADRARGARAYARGARGDGRRGASGRPCVRADDVAEMLVAAHVNALAFRPTDAHLLAVGINDGSIHVLRDRREVASVIMPRPPDASGAARSTSRSATPTPSTSRRRPSTSW